MPDRTNPSISRAALLRIAPLTTFPALPSFASTSHKAGVLLRDGSLLPLASFGVQIYDDRTAEALTLQALKAGFTSFFTSADAGNQRGFARALAQSGVQRSNLFVAASVLSDDVESFTGARSRTARACVESLRNLERGGLSGVDMLMLERPARTRAGIAGQWSALRGMRDAGACQSLGVCNFGLDELDALVEESPLVNQLPFSLGVRMPHAAVLKAHARRGVQLQAWGPLGGPDNYFPKSLLAECAAIGRPSGWSGQQVALRWILQSGVAFCVHSGNPRHLRDDIAVLDFELSEEAMHTLSALATKPWSA